MTLIIAEAGVNHNGDFNLAKELIDIALDSGADIIKFQTFKAEDLVTKKAKKAEYQKRNLPNSDDQFSMLKELELSYNEFEKLKRYCDQKSIEFLSTAFSEDSLDFLIKIGVKRIKIPSGEINNLPYLLKASSYNLTIILSTGMSTMKEISDAVQIFSLNGIESKKLTLLHCTTEYPTKIQSVNLNAMKSIQNMFDISVGYSDHTRNYEVPIAAVANGATIIEKHFTKSRDLPGPDHNSSLEPNELSEMISSIRNTEILMGSSEKKPTKEELQNLLVARKSIVAKKKIKKGELLSEENITTKRPADGLSPMEWNNILNTIATKDFDEDDLIEG